MVVDDIICNNDLCLQKKVKFDTRPIMLVLLQGVFKTIFIFCIFTSTMTTLCHAFAARQPNMEIYTNNHKECEEGEYKGVIRISKVISIL